MRFSGGGDLVYSASTDCSILAVDIASGKAQARKKDAHGSAINRLATLSETQLGSGALARGLRTAAPAAGARAVADSLQDVRARFLQATTRAW